MPELSRQCNLLHAAWIADQSAVLCAMPAPPHRYRLVGLDGRKMDETSIPPDRDFRALTYLSHSRAVVFTEVRPSLMSDLDQRDVWVYWLDTDELRLLAAGQNLGRSVAYRRWRF
jgi:hypothetical protein